MNTGSSSNWKKTVIKKVVDQRQLELLPTWASTHARAPTRGEQGRAVYESGPGREMANVVVSLLTQARDKAVVSSFLLADKAVEDAIHDAATRGVHVYVLLASEARLGREEGEGEFDRRVLKHHKAMLARLGGHVLFRSASHFHAKVVVIDPETRPAGILLTANLTSEALERNEELAVTLNAAEVAEATQYLKWAMWESAEHELVDPKDRFKTARPLGKLPHPTRASAIVVTTAKANTVRDELLRLIDEARSRIVVSSFGWDVEHDVVGRLCARAREGLEVTVLARVRPASMAALMALAEAGASVFAFRWLHAKAFWTDTGQALVMSANLQRDGLEHGFELGVRLADDRAQEVLERLTAWRNTAPWRLMLRPKLGELSGAAMLWHGGRGGRGQFEDVEVKSSMDIDLGVVAAGSADLLDAPQPPVPSNGQLPKMAHELHCSWVVAAPTLATKSKEQRRPAKGKEQPQPYAPPVFREPSGRLVVAVKSPQELERARAVRAEVGAAAIVLARGAAPR